MEEGKRIRGGIARRVLGHIWEHRLGYGIGLVGWLFALGYLYYDYMEYGSLSLAHLTSTELEVLMNHLLIALAPFIFMALGWAAEGKARLYREERQRARELAALSDKYEKLLENELVGIYIIQDGKFKYVNRGVGKIFGYRPEEMIERLDLLDLVHPEDHQLVLEKIQERIEGGEEFAHYTFRGVKKNGEILDCEVLGSRIDYEGRPAIQGILHDISLAKEAERLQGNLLKIAGEILASYDLEYILHRVAQVIVELSPFQRAAVSLYDITAEDPLESPVMKIYSAGLTMEEEQRLVKGGGMPPQYRMAAFSEEFRLGNSYYVRYDRVPWGPEEGIPGRVSLDGWHPNDFLFIPLRTERGIIGHISVDDPTTPRAPTREMLEPLEVFAELAALAVERAARMVELRRHKEWLRGSYQIGQELACYRTLEGLLNGVMEILKREIHYDYGAVLLLRGEELVVEVVESALADRKIDVEARIFLNQGITGWVAAHRQPALVNDVTQDPRYIMGHEEIRSELAVPIQLEDELLGVLNVESTAKDRFRPEDQEFLSSVAAQLAVAIAELRSRERLDQAYRFGQKLAQIEEVPKLIAYILPQLERHFEYDWGLVLLREGDMLKLAGQLGRRGTKVFDRDSVKIGEGLIGWVAEQRKPLLVNDVAQDPRYIQGFLETRSELAVPIQTPEELFGVIDIQSEEAGHFTDEDKLVLESLAGQMAIALSNIRRREKLKEIAIRDPLTGLYNRRYFNEIIERELERSRRYGHHLTFLMVDLDDFHKVNNLFGHLKGDEVLREIAELLKKNVRAADMVFRYGGDEFLILMPETDSEAEEAIGRLQQAVEEWNKKSGLDCEIGVSIGVSSWSPDKERRIEEVLEEADRRMYQAKTMKERS